MKKTAKIFITLMFTMATVACGGSESSQSDMTLRIVPPIATEHGTTTEIKVQSPVSGAFERVQEISLVEVGELQVNEEAVRGVVVELTGSSGIPVFSTTVYFDGAVAAAPIDLVTKVPVDEEMKVRMQLVVEAEEKVYPEVFEKVLMAQEAHVEVVPIQTVR